MARLWMMLATALVIFGTGPASAQMASKPSCSELTQAPLAALPDAATIIRSAIAVPASNDMPALCRLDSNIAPTTGFRMWLPLEHWNGKLAQSGCGGRCGDIINEGCEVMVARGYACLASDLGHKGTAYDIVWAVNNLQGQVDFGFRSTHVANLAGRAIVARFYGRAAAYVYYVGASTGGRQGLVAAQRFPEDFDGIIAGEPAMGYRHRTEASRQPAWPDSVVGSTTPLFADGRSLLSTQEILMLHASVVAACDMDDNLKDGLISDPRTCSFDPARLRCTATRTPDCLADRQIVALKAVYASGTPLGSEKAWIGAYIGPDGGPGRYGATKSPSLDDPYAWIFFDATNPDLRPFKARGGKLIVYQGWADETTLPLNPIYYYETVERVMGGRTATQDFFRLFMIPGQAHFPGNGGAETVDYLGYLEAWVERGIAPDMLLATKLRTMARPAGPVTFASDLRPDNYEFTRPVYPYPIQARYKGGDPTKASSFGPDRRLK